MTRTGRQPRPLGLWVLMTGAAVLCSAGAASADGRHGWAWQAQHSGTPGLGSASGIPAGDLAVAWLGQPDKLTYLGVGGPGVGPLTGATLELVVDPAAPNLPCMRPSCAPV